MTETEYTTQLTAYTSLSLIEQADKVFSRIGCTINEAVTAFINHVAQTQEMPFEYKGLVFNAETLEAMQEVDDMINGRIPMPPTISTEELFAEIYAEIEAEGNMLLPIEPVHE